MASSDLSRAALLEPAAGDGAFVVEAGKRLVRSLKRRGMALAASRLVGRIRSYELHAGEARRARARIRAALEELGATSRVARKCSRAWVKTQDFLLTQVRTDSFTHVVGNPPYVRWRKVPQRLRVAYATTLRPEVARGDLFLPFLDKALNALKPEGRCGFVCSNRWRFVAFANDFRTTWLPRIEILSERTIQAHEAFEQQVSSYPTILIARKLPEPRKKHVRKAKRQTLAELGCTIRVGPALGNTRAFVVKPDETPVEPWRMASWIDSKDIKHGRISATGNRVITMHDARGNLVAVTRYPKIYRRLRKRKADLNRRYFVKTGGQWFSPIDTVRAADWSRPKILVPEMAKHPRAAIDYSGAIPSHGVYAIFVDDDNIERIYRRLRGKKLAQALKPIAPRVNGGYYRCYRRFLAMIRI